MTNQPSFWNCARDTREILNSNVRARSCCAKSVPPSVNAILRRQYDELTASGHVVGKVGVVRAAAPRGEIDYCEWAARLLCQGQLIRGSVLTLAKPEILTNPEAQDERFTSLVSNGYSISVGFDPFRRLIDGKTDVIRPKPAIRSKFTESPFEIEIPIDPELELGDLGVVDLGGDKGPPAKGVLEKRTNLFHLAWELAIHFPELPHSRAAHALAVWTGGNRKEIGRELRLHWDLIVYGAQNGLFRILNYFNPGAGFREISNGGGSLSYSSYRSARRKFIRKVDPLNLPGPGGDRRSKNFRRQV